MALSSHDVVTERSLDCGIKPDACLCHCSFLQRSKFSPCSGMSQVMVNDFEDPLNHTCWMEEVEESSGTDLV